jgi:hypothetical protein
MNKKEILKLVEKEISVRSSVRYEDIKNGTDISKFVICLESRNNDNEFKELFSRIKDSQIPILLDYIAQDDIDLILDFYSENSSDLLIKILKNAYDYQIPFILYRASHLQIKNILETSEPSLIIKIIDSADKGLIRILVRVALDHKDSTLFMKMLALCGETRIKKILRCVYFKREGLEYLGKIKSFLK